MDFVYLAFLTVLLVVFSLVLVASIVIVNVLVFTHASDRGVLAVMIASDVILLLLAAILIDNWLDERHRKKRGLPKSDYYTEVKVIEFDRLFRRWPSR